MSNPSLFSSSLPLKDMTGIVGREELRQSMACFQLKVHWNWQKEIIPVFPFIFFTLASPLVLRWEEEDLVEVLEKLSCRRLKPTALFPDSFFVHACWRSLQKKGLLRVTFRRLICLVDRLEYIYSLISGRHHSGSWLL